MNPVEEQLAAYNARNIDDFMKNFYEDVHVLDGAGTVTLTGWNAKHERYSKAFVNEPNVHCEVTQRIEHGEYVVDHERLTGFKDGETRLAVAIYKVVGDKIVQVQFLK